MSIDAAKKKKGKERHDHSRSIERKQSCPAGCVLSTGHTAHKHSGIEDELKKLGANYIQAGQWRGFAVRDGNLITGQQNFSGAETAEAVIAALGE